MNWIAILSSVLLSSCSQQSTEGPTRGNLHVVVEESVAPPLIRVIETFNALYAPAANVTYSLLPFSSMPSAVDTARLFFTSEKIQLNEATSGEYTPINLTVAYDAVVAIVDEKNSTEKISTGQLEGLLKGKIKSWKELGPTSTMRTSIRFFASAQSLPMPFYVRRFGVSALPASAERNSASLVSAVEENTSALGLVGIGWIDSLRPGVKMLSVARSNEDRDTTFAPPKEVFERPFSPHPANLYLNHYPMKRAVWMQGRTTGKDLAAGFSAFIVGAEGQKILLQHGWLPATQKIKLRAQFPSE
jgi:phosphate transport system substrate-binding protein